MLGGRGREEGRKVGGKLRKMKVEGDREEMNLSLREEETIGGIEYG